MRKEKEGLECEIDLLRKQWNKYDDEHGRMDKEGQETSRGSSFT